MGSIFNEVVGPDMVGMFRPQPNARAVIQPKPPAFGLFVVCPLKSDPP
jgi:hypothetical protein